MTYKGKGAMSYQASLLGRGPNVSYKLVLLFDWAWLMAWNARVARR